MSKEIEVKTLTVHVQRPRCDACHNLIVGKSMASCHSWANGVPVITESGHVDSGDLSMARDTGWLRWDLCGPCIRRAIDFLQLPAGGGSY